MNLDWHVGKVAKRLPHLRKPVLVAGLPGIGNVGKLAADALVDGLKAKKAYEFFSYAFPHSVFVNESNLVELPTISLYYATCPKGKHDLLILAGDVQPIDEYSCYEFSDTVLDLVLAGVITGKQKTLLPGKLVTSFVMGTRRLYDWVNDNGYTNFASWVETTAQKANR